MLGIGATEASKIKCGACPHMAYSFILGPRYLGVFTTAS